ncbi:MAG: nucleotidyltransferase family protein [Bythopirellula sp.]|nr:nucleotidyltransferase family protein [Bythopirellula sp.]
MSTGEQIPTVVSFGEDVLDRMVLAVEKVRDRLRRATTALDAHNVPYAVIGGNAVAAWVSKVDPSLARNTADVDLLVNRSDFESIKNALQQAGFIYRHVKSIDMFLDGDGAKARDAVHILFAGERVKQADLLPAPELSIADEHPTYRLLDLEPLVKMKLTSFRRKDQVHIQDLIDARLVDQSWTAKLPPEIAARLQELLDDPEG